MEEGEGAAYGTFYVAEKNGGDDGTRTRGLCRDSLGINVLSATYVLSGGCQVAEKDCRNRSLWVNLWVRIFRARMSWSGALTSNRVSAPSRML